MSKHKGPLDWWYRMTSPPEPELFASFQERERFRRGRTGSQISIFLFLLLLISFPAAFAGSNPLLVTILLLNLFLLLFALVCNRLHMVNLAGAIIVLSVVLSPVVNILTTPGGINTSALPIFGLLILPVICAVSFLPPGWVFLVAGCTSLFTLMALRFLPSSGEVHHVVQGAFLGMVTPIVLSQWIVANVAYIWVRGTRQALLRADRAEEIARLVHEVAERDHRIAQQKQQLDASILEIERVHQEVANGNVAARVPMLPHNVLWSVSGKLNNLLTRYQRLQSQVNELQHLNALYQSREVSLQRLPEREERTTPRFPLPHHPSPFL